MKKFSLSLMAVTLVSILAAQDAHTPYETAMEYLQTRSIQWQLTADDIQQLRVTDAYTDAHNAVTHVYLVQQYHGIDVDRATFNVNIKNGEVLFAGERLVRDLASKIEPGNQKLTAANAVSRSFESLEFALRGPVTQKSEIDRHHYIFEKGPHSYSDMDVQLIYARNGRGVYTLAWDVTMEPVGSADLWKVRVDASTGDLIGKLNLTAHCAFPDNYISSQGACQAAALSPGLLTGSGSAIDSARYNIIEIPFESPKYADRILIASPADPDASPYGWHDLDGIQGPDTTITFGNNVRAFIDRDGDYTFNEPATNGGDSLLFDFPYDPMTEPVDHQDAAVTNLFYMNNIMHDFTYHYGFNEVAGNFQNINLTGQGQGDDYVLAHAQFGAGTADPPLSNATFGTPTDGGSGRMRMYVWEGAGANELLRVESPPEVAGSIETETTSGWAADLTATAVTGEVVTVDGSGNATAGCESGSPSRGCKQIVNDLTGKIALIDRGDCEFGCKALNAQNAGAIAFIICNFDETLVLMGGGAVGDQVTIPGVFIRSSDCQKIKVFANNGLVVSLVNESAGAGPSRRSGSLDNTIVAHEYGHGISNRLIGGPSRADCLNNYDNDNNDTYEDGEQMGEGWSDFFALVATVQPGDDGEVQRGIASFATGRPQLGGRSYPYTTNMSINPQTYDDIAFSAVPHGIGAVWCAMLWDLYWALTDQYGYDPDLYHGTGGNNLAIQLVMDGMKFQTCDPGLVDGRDAILAADAALTGGANQKLIWEVFARRGLGYSAQQGENRFRLDGREAFDINPFVIKELKILKEMTPYIEPGADITVQLKAVNHKDEEVTDVVVQDVIPEGTSVIPGSLPQQASVVGDVINFELGTLASGDTVVLSYQLSSAPDLFSRRLFFDDMESGDFNWDLIFNDENPYFWGLQSFLANSGEMSWAAQNYESASDYSLVTADPLLVTGEKPVLYFEQNYQTERFFDAGIVQISRDDGLNWETISQEHVIRGDYEGKVQYGLFAIPNLKGWYGDSEGWIPTMIDLSDYLDSEINVRFRLGSDDSIAVVGWFIDDVEIMEAFNYNSEACVSSAEGDQACTEAPRMGAVVATSEVSAIDDGPRDRFLTEVYPNPATETLNIDIVAPERQMTTLRLISTTGNTLWSERAVVNDVYRTAIDVRNVPKGFYFVQIESEGEKVVKKVVIQ